MKICGTKSNRKTGIYSSGRRGKKEEEDAVGTLWLRLGEDQNKRKTEAGRRCGRRGEREGGGRADSPLCCFLLWDPEKIKKAGLRRVRRVTAPQRARSCSRNKWEQWDWWWWCPIQRPSRAEPSQREVILCRPVKKQPVCWLVKVTAKHRAECT